MGVKPAPKGPAIDSDDPENPTTHNRATHFDDACRSDTPTRVAPGRPTYAAGTQQMRASLGSPTILAIEHKQ